MMTYLIKMLVGRERRMKKNLKKPVETYLKKKNMMKLMTKARNQVEIHPAWWKKKLDSPAIRMFAITSPHQTILTRAK